MILKPNKQKFTSALLTAQKHNHSEEFMSARHKIHVTMKTKHEYLAKSLCLGEQFISKHFHENSNMYTVF